MEYWKNLSLENLFYIDENGIVQEEQWVCVPDFEHYMGSDLGRIKAKERICLNSKGILKVFKEKTIKQSISTDGYLRVVFRKNKKAYYFKSHKIVGMCFLNHSPCGFEEVIDHINDIKTDNRRINLRAVKNRVNVSKGKMKNNPYTGISFLHKKNSWRVSIQIKRINISLGTKKDAKEASELYECAVKNSHLFNGDRDEFRNLVRSCL